jgi:hypothetical protein
MCSKAGIFLLTLLVPVCVSAGGGRATAHAPATVTLVRPISIAMGQDLWFGNLIVEANLGTQQIIQRAADGGGDRQADPPGITQVTRSSALWHNARFEVKGEPGLGFSIVMPNHPIVILNGGIPMKVSLNYYSSDTYINPVGNSIWVGGRLELPNNPQFGRYSGDFEVTVAYN